MAKQTQNKQCFISHCSDDKDFVKNLDEVLRLNYSNCNPFNTSLDINSSYAGEKRFKMIKDRIEESQSMIAVVSESYLRSVICISEIAHWAFLGREEIIVLIMCEEGKKVINDLFGEAPIYIDAIGLVTPQKIENWQSNMEQIYSKRMADKESIDEHVAKVASEMVNALEKYQFQKVKKNNQIEAFTKLFQKQGVAFPKRPYLGSDDETSKLVQNCKQYGVSEFGMSLKADELISHYKDEIQNMYILSTTGKNILNNLSSNVIPELLARGANVYVLLPNKYSEFTKDVAEIESSERPKRNWDRISNEFDNVMILLQDCVQKVMESKKKGEIGHVYVGCTFTTLRQTITFAELSSNYACGQISLTLPPQRTSERTPSMRFEGNIENDSIAQIVHNHIHNLIDYAGRKEALIEVLPTKEVNYFFLEKYTAKEEWRKIKADAEADKRYNSEYEFIEISAQHPLVNNAPNLEFSLRLDEGVRLYNSFTNEGKKVHLFVPGSIHTDKNKKADSISLSEAGQQYLISKGIPKEDILGIQDVDEEIKKAGIFNSCDECWAASKLFSDTKYRKLHCICSSGQMLKKKLFYYAYGVNALMHTVDCETETYHDDVEEIFEIIPTILYKNHTWESSECEQYIKSREERRPEQG